MATVNVYTFSTSWCKNQKLELKHPNHLNFFFYCVCYHLFTSRAPDKSPIYFVKSSSDVSRVIGKCSIAVSMPDDSAFKIFYKKVNVKIPRVLVAIVSSFYVINKRSKFPLFFAKTIIHRCRKCYNGTWGIFSSSGISGAYH